MHDHDVYMVEIGILVSNLYRQLDDVLNRPISTSGDLIAAWSILEAVEEEFALLFEEEGTGTPELLTAFGESVSRLHRAEQRLLRVEAAPAIRHDALEQVHAHVHGTRRPSVLVAFEADPSMRRLADRYQMVLRQGVVTGTAGKCVAQVPEPVLAALMSRSIGVFEQVPGDPGPELLESALALWDPYYEGSAFETFDAALGAAARLG
jgi:hypothetical protein